MSAAARVPKRKAEGIYPRAKRSRKYPPMRRALVYGRSGITEVKSFDLQIVAGANLVDISNVAGAANLATGMTVLNAVQQGYT